MINDIYYTVVEQEARELRDRAAQDRLAKEAEQQRRRARAAAREVRRLERVVNGRRSWWTELLQQLGIGTVARTEASLQRVEHDHRSVAHIEHPTGATSDKA